MNYALLALAATADPRSLDECGQPFSNCLESKCCVGEPRYGCHKKQGKAFAQCRKVDENAGGCTTDGMWQCPGEWEDCTTQKYQECWDSQCCFDASFACFRKAGRAFAQCRPMPKDCVDTDEWLCPGWVKPAPPPPHAAGAHHGAQTATPTPTTAQCSDPFLACTDNHCCNGEALGFRCIEKKNQFYAQCIKPSHCVTGNGNTCKDVTHQPILPPPGAGHGAKGGGTSITPAAGATTPAGGGAVDADGGEGGGSMVLPILIFLLALAMGAGFAYWYKINYMLQPPTMPPVAEDGSEMTPSTRSSMNGDGGHHGGGSKKEKKKKAIEESIVEDNPDEDDEDDEEAVARKKKKEKKKKEKKAGKAGDDESRSSLRRMDDFEMDL